MEVKKHSVSYPCLILSADSRFCTPDYFNDHIWEIIPGGGDPPGLSLTTSFGLRAKYLRIFPRFSIGDMNITDPARFSQPPATVTNYPNYLSLTYSPLPEVRILSEYWVPDSHTIAGRFHFQNDSDKPISLEFDLIVLLNPMTEGHTMAHSQSGRQNYLHGQAGGLVPVFILSEQPEPGKGPLTSLTKHIHLDLNQEKSLVWSMSALSSIEESLDMAVRIQRKNWDSNVSRITMENERRAIQVITNNPEWDMALKLSQKVASSLVFPGNQHLPGPSFVLSRLPDHGYSSSDSGVDHPYSWAGQDALSAYYLITHLLPMNLETAEGILHNFLFVQDDNGFIDWKPGLGGQRSRWLAYPILSTIARKIDHYKLDSAWLSGVVPSLKRFIGTWLDEMHDRDKDGWPEWDNPMQTSIVNLPIHNRWHPQAQGAEIVKIEGPLMAALLYKECEDLIFLAERSGLTEMIDEVSNWKKQISEEYGKTWDPESSQFRYRDSLTHHSPKGVILIDRYGPGTYFSKKTLGHAQSLVMKTIIAKEETRSFIINIEGEDDISRISEKFTSSNFTWSQGYAVLNTQRAYTKVTRFEVNGISDQDRIILSTIDYTQSDITQLIAIWANIGTEDQQQKIIKKFLIQNNIQNYGIPLVQPRFRPRGMPFVEDVHLPLNLLIGEGLVRTGNRKAAARLMERILNGISNNLKDYGNFREYFNASDRKPSGARNHLCGLVPISLLLEITGIDFSSSKEVVVEGLYPFSFPITVKYAGITVTRDKKRTLVNWPHCEPVVLTGPGPHKVTLEPI